MKTLTPEQQEEACVLGAAKAFARSTPEFKNEPKVVDQMIEIMLEQNLPSTDVESWSKAFDAVCKDSVAYVPGDFNEDGTKKVFLDNEALRMMPADLMKEKSRDPVFARGMNLILSGGKQ